MCFLTSHTELARLGYRVNAFRYTDKKHLDNIEKTNSHEVKLCNGLKAVIGRVYNKEFRKAFFK